MDESALETAGLDVAELSRARVLTAWSAQAGLKPRVIERAAGSVLYGADGSRLLDFSSGLINVNVGHAHPRVVAAIQEQAAKLTYVTPGFATGVRARLADALHEISPGRALTKTFFTSGGSDANDSAILMARSVTGRHKILASYRSYHGSTYGAVTLSGDQRRGPTEPGIPGVVHFFTPYPYRSPFRVPPDQEAQAALAHLEDVLLYEGAESVAAIVLEPITGSNGIIVPPDGYLQGVRQICNRHGILLILDEVMTGFGRTGAWFAANHWQVAPDMMTIAKGITSGYVPLGAVMVNERVASHFDHHVLGAGLTYSGHPLACGAGLANLQAYREERLIERSAQLGAALGTRLQSLAERCPLVGEVRGKGLFWGIELVRDRSARTPWTPWNQKGPGPMAALLAEIAAEGVYVYGRWNILLVAPPLVVTEAELEEGVAAIEAALLRESEREVPG